MGALQDTVTFGDRPAHGASARRSRGCSRMRARRIDGGVVAEVRQGKATLKNGSARASAHSVSHRGVDGRD